jgi:hypothetical protein
MQQFTYLGCTQVIILEVKSEGEFAPIKVPVGPGDADTAATACALILTLHQQVGSVTPVEMLLKSCHFSSICRGCAILALTDEWYFCGPGMIQNTIPS